MLSQDDWRTLFALLDTAWELPAEERQAWLQSLPEAQAGLRPLLAQYLTEEAAAGSFLDQPVHLAAVPEDDDLLGPWRLLRLLGEGGMASVWLAERADGAHKRTVALKLPHASARSPRWAERFARERDILSTLSHPHIAAVLDAGHHQAQLWLAMEFVDGRPITEAVQGLPQRARLLLMLQVLQAVQHAHAQLVIHRDIKPGNVLVDAAGQVKLLDFGVAKLLAADADDAALTQLGERAMTPAYASPEQVAGRVLGTASDVYALGVLMHELLTGELPYPVPRTDRARLEAAILQGDVRLSHEALRGNLQAIVAKALALSPAARYESAAAMAQDIEHHLANRPIQARPVGPARRLALALRRHAAAVAVAGAVLVLLLAGLGATAWQAQQAREQAHRAQAVQRFLTQVLAGNDPQQAQGRERSARELLDLSAARIGSDFAAQPALAAQLHQVVAGLYIELGAMAPAGEHLRLAQALYQQLGQTGSDDDLDARLREAQVLVEQRNLDAAAPVLERTRALADARHRTPHRWSGRLLAYEAWVASQQGRLEPALAAAQEALAAQRQLSGELSAEYLGVASTVASLYLARGRLADAQALLQHIEDHGAGVSGYPITDQLGNRYSLASLRFNRGDHAAAEASLATLVPSFERHLGPQHDRTVIARALWARALAERGQTRQAVAEQDKNVAQTARRQGTEPEAWMLARLQRERLLSQDGRHDEAVREGREVLAFFEARYPQPTRYREAARWYLAEALLARAMADADRLEGLQLLQASIDQARQMGPADNPLERASKTLSLAIARRDAAQAEQACQTLSDALGSDNPRVQRCRALQAWLQALAAAPAEQAQALQRFDSAAALVLAPLPSTHALHAQLRAARDRVLAPVAEPVPRLWAFH